MAFPLTGIGVALPFVAGAFPAELDFPRYGYVTVFVLYLLATTLGAFFAAGLVYSVEEAFHGRNRRSRSGWPRRGAGGARSWSRP